MKDQPTHEQILQAFEGARLGGDESKPEVLSEMLAKGILCNLVGTRSSFTVESAMIELGFMRQHTRRVTAHGKRFLQKSKVYRNAVQLGV